MSTTQAGRSEPSISTVTRTVACTAPPFTSSAATSWPTPRMREPTGTGAGKRTLSQP